MKIKRQSISSGDNSTNLMADGDIEIHIEGNIPTALVDQKIEEEVGRLRKSRFFVEFDTASSSLRLGKRLADGDLSGGSNNVRGPALAWSARLLSRSGDLEPAKQCLEVSKSLGDFTETKIAEAFIISQERGKGAALQALVGIRLEASRSAGLMIVAHHDGAEIALKWMRETGYKSEDLDADGKSVLMSHQLQLGRWDEVAQTVDTLSEADFNATPTLHHLSALAALVTAVPRDFRAVILTQVPFEARNFPLASDAAALDARRAAHKYFLRAVDVATRLACPHAARTYDEYALWLELLDPAQAGYGKARLESKLRDPETALGFVHYALQFGIKLDAEAVERDIDREIARNGGITLDAAIARFAIAFTKSTAEEVADYISRHQNQLSAHINPKLMKFRQIEMFSYAGLIEQANNALEDIIEQGITAEEEGNLRRVISQAQGNDSVESRKKQYKSTGTLDDLIGLVVELEKHQYWSDLCHFGKLLFDETHSIQHAQCLANAFNKTYRSADLIKLLNENPEFLSQSNHLRMSYAWGLYNEGMLLESRTELEKLSDEAGGQNYRALQVNLAISMGDWASLSIYITNEYQNREQRNAQEMIGAAQLALRLGLPYAKDLIFEAAAKAGDDSAALAAAYFIATSAGWEDDPKVFQWLERAAELSGDEGPLQRMSLKEILDRKPEWDRRESETWRMVAEGKVPIFLAGQSLNRTLIDLTAFPALANIDEPDPRRRSLIPAYSGRRKPLKLDARAKAVALDATALLTLSFLDILDVALDAFESVYVPHSTLRWLFEERQKAAFHQPSRIANAHKIRHLLATNMLEEFTSSAVVSSDLSDQIGDELAALIAEAEKAQNSGESQHIVVRSAPVHRISSLMEEEADLSKYSAVLSGCLAVVDKLRQKGKITSDEERRARAYFQLREKPWTNQPDISDGATLYLDDLAITYLSHLGLLGKLKTAGLTAVASPRELSESDALISYELISGEVQDVIERIRTSLKSRIESRHVTVSSRYNFDHFEERSIPEHPSVGILALVPQCKIAIIDDRFFNQHATIDNGNAKASVFSTLDLLDGLVASGALSHDERLELRTRLRRAGYIFVPVDESELKSCLLESVIDDGEVLETAELKAIREAILRVRMSDWLQLPEEAPWLEATLTGFVRVLRNLWVDGADLEEAAIRSNWLADHIDVRGWANSLIPESADNIVRVGRAAHILLLLAPHTGVQNSTVDAYWKWVEERILAPLQEQFPEVYEPLLDWCRRQVAEVAGTLVPEEADS